MNTGLLLAALLTACSGSAGDPGSSCHTKQTKSGVVVWCDDGTLTTLDNGQMGSDGKDGQDGKNGAMGSQGDPGDPATATHIIESFFCTAGLEDTLLHYDYNAILWNSGDLFVTGTVASPLNSAGKTAIYTPSQKGYLDAGVDVEFDQDEVADGGWFKLSLYRATLTSTVEYHATDGKPVTQTWTLDPATCVHNLY